MSEAGGALIWTPFGARSDAESVSRTMVEEGLVACANIVPQVTSIFRYEGKVQSADEVGVLFKTDMRLLAAATKRLTQLHPYDTPAILGWQADAAPQVTLDWLAGLAREWASSGAD